jgi:hypothetical protein
LMVVVQVDFINKFVFVTGRPWNEKQEVF